jgi:nucleoid DNA-binding protein
MEINIASHISELLYKHNQVNIPGLGGFHSSYRETMIDQYGNILPPSKELHFDSSSTFHDDKLIQSLVEEYDLTFGAAVKVVDNYVQTVKKDLQKKAVFVPNVGRLYLDNRNSKIMFASSNQNFLEDSFGLPKLQRHPISRREKKEVTPQKQREAVITTAVAVKKPSKLRKVFAGVWGDPSLRTLIIILLILIIAVPQLSRLANPDKERISPSIVNSDSDLITENETNIIDKNSTFNPFKKTVSNEDKTIQDTPKESKVVPEEVQNGIAEKSIEKVNSELERNAKTPIKSSITTTKIESDTKNYIIVIGNFSTQDNTNTAIKDVKKVGYKAYSRKIDNNKIRVGIKINCKASEIDAKLKKAQIEYPGAWLMNR